MVKYITYRGKEYPVRLSYRVFKGLKNEIPQSNIKDIGSMDPQFLETMLWYGLVSGHAFLERENPLKKEDMEDVLDHCMMEFTKMIPEFFPKAKVGNVDPNLGVGDQELPEITLEDPTATSITT